MRTDINLAIRKQIVKKSIRKVFLISFLIFITVFLLSALAIAYNFTLTNKLTQLSQPEMQMKNKINEFSAKKDNFIIVQDRLSSITQIINSRKNIDKKISSVLSYFPDSVTIKNINVSNDGASITIISSDLSAVDQLLDTMELA